MSMDYLFTPHHVQLLNACYPPKSTLLAAGPDYSPSSHELSRLTYYASNHPGKLTKLGSELDKRISSESRKARAGNIRARALLLISLAILRSLSAECRGDIALLTPSLISSLNVTLTSVPQDLEILARLASVFTAWTTYTNAHLVGADRSFTEEYLSVLQHFANIARCGHDDQEIRNRTRLIGFAAVTGALNSEALYNDSKQFRAQTSILLRPILVSLFQTDMGTLERHSSTVKDTPGSPYLTELRTRPDLERRAASIHIHVDGDSGPTFDEVSDASLRSLFSLLSHAGVAQLGHIMQSSFDNIDALDGWTNQTHCCWFARQTAEWAQYQYRYVVPTRLVEKLLENQDVPAVKSLHTTLAAMVTTVLSSSIPMINLSSSDLMSKLLTLLLRRVTISPSDILIPSIVNSTASLGCRIYYSDQIQDLAAEIINRLVMFEAQSTLEVNDIEKSEEIRSSSICCLLGALYGLIRMANEHENTTQPNRHSNSSREPLRSDEDANLSSGRTRVSPEIWQDTLNLICDGDIRIRTEYARNLAYYIAKEIPKNDNDTEIDGGRKTRRHSGSTSNQVGNVNLFLNSGDAGSKLLNAVHAYTFILATNPGLASDDHPSSTLSEPQINSPTVPTPTSIPNSAFSSCHSQYPSRIPKARKASLLHRLARANPTKETHIPFGNREDYANIASILVTAQENLPVRGLISAVPMLFHLDAVLHSRSTEPEAIVLLKNIIIDVWTVIARNWECPELINLCEAVERPENPDQPGIDCRKALDILVSCVSIKEVFGLPQENLYQRLSRPWDPERALHDFVDNSNTFYPTVRGDNLSPLLKISPALMQIENMSMQSLARSTRGLGVTDLREALEGRCSMSNPNLVKPASIISTLDQASSMTSGDPALQLSLTPSRKKTKRRAQGDVREVLTKLGIGKQSNNLLKSSFPAIAKSGNQ